MILPNRDKIVILSPAEAQSVKKSLAEDPKN